MSQTYSDVDASADPMGAVAWQERMSTWPAVSAYKDRTCQLLADGDLVVDVGCGPGVDLIAMGVHRCVGVELSATMVTAASARAALVCRADAHYLPFAAGSVGGVRADRVVQHLADPHRAVREMIRVAGSGARVVIADPDQDTLVIQVPGVRQSVLDRLICLRRDTGYRNGTLVSRIPALMRDLGLRQITAETFPLILTDPDDAFGLPTWPDTWRAEGGFTDEETLEWHAAMESRPLNGFLFSVTFLVVAGTKP